MKKNMKILMLVASAVLISSCSTPIKVTTDYDKAVRFDDYKTFAVGNLTEHGQAVSQLNQNRIFKAVSDEMIKKGFQETTSVPDLKVFATTIMQSKSEISSSTNFYGGGYYSPYAWGMGSSHTSFNVRDFTDGSIIIEVVDVAANKLIWQGVGNKEIDSPSKNPDAAIPQAIATIMKDFPPGQSKKK